MKDESGTGRQPAQGPHPPTVGLDDFGGGDIETQGKPLVRLPRLNPETPAVGVDNALANGDGQLVLLSFPVSFTEPTGGGADEGFAQGTGLGRLRIQGNGYGNVHFVLAHLDTQD